MINNAKNGCLTIGNTTMDYISFGSGRKNLVLIPGLGDGLKTARGMALPFSVLLKSFTKDYTVYDFSRKNKLEPGYSTKDMAFDLKVAMEILGIKKADIIGISQGGMIAQQFAVHYPEYINKLVLAVTSSRPNPTITGVISEWIEMAKRDDFRELMLDNIEKMYTESFIKKNRWLLSAAGKVGKPASYERFIIMAEACLRHDCYEKLGLIQSPTLVIGGEKDQIVGAQASRDIAEKIKDCRLVMYPEYGHAVYEEEREFTKAVQEFLRE